jgi:uncharacterized protein (TIGR00725 family)
LSTQAATPLIAILGSARIGTEDPRWDDAYALGHALADQGWSVMTGGYGGLMAATVEGAASAATTVTLVGLPMTGWTSLTPHPANTELRWSADYAERLNHLLSADVVIALPGGVGTLAEATVVWSALQTEPDAARLILFGAEWRRLLDAFATQLVIGPEDLALARSTLDVAETVDAVATALRDHSAIPLPRG